MKKAGVSGWVAATMVLLALAGSAAAELPDGEILYYREVTRGKGDLALLDLRTGESRLVGRSGSRPDHFPSWSADGERLAFESYRKGGWHVWVSQADGSDARRLSNVPDFSTRYYEFDPAFAPDGRTVAFVGGESLWKVTLDAPQPVRITPEANGVEETAPAYSPDGKSLAFAGYARPAKRWDVYTMASGGGAVVNLTRGEGTNLAPAWSPDGRHLLFYSDRSGSFELHEMTAEGKEVRPLLTKAQREAAGFESASLVDPWDNDWGATEQYRAGYSPDGRWVVFSRNVEGDRELFIARRDGSEIHRITRRKGLDGQPAWRPR